ncbi:endonuclease [Flavobacterium antarcticum]|uniref:endonuclease n=1 Tax=Flavobacterium antarcticum TaxID=271155 RepID=UPI0003B73085|nr:endonuclease [Flavobacterium antarcticum]
MKKNYTFLLLLVSVVLFAQAPANYYNNATGTGYTLKTQLKTIISTGAIDKGYAALWNLYYTSDVRADGKVWDMYSDCNMTFGTDQDTGSSGTSQCQKYNREHSFPKSWFNDAAPMVSDAYHILPADKYVNGVRGNFAYGIVGTANFTSFNGSKRGNNIAPGAPSAIVFEPADEFKGDFARIYFYMATRYQDVVANWTGNDSDGDSMLDGTSNKVFSQWTLDMLYQWHIADPVSVKETNRNNVVYNYQNNRNPFVDHPEYVAIIWGASLSTTQFNTIAAVTVYPNPSNDHRINISYEDTIDEIQLINVNGQIMQQITKPASSNSTYTIENIPTGFYFLRLSNGGQSVVKKVIVN